jgi:hypothetical protein
VDVTSCMEARNAPWPAGDGLDGAEAVACIAGEPLRCGGGRAVQLRFGVQCYCGLACSAPAIQGFLAAASLPGVASLAGVASQPGVEGRHAARCTRRSAAASVASISAGFAGGELGAWVSLSDGRPRICVRSVR